MARGHDIRSGPRVTRPFVDPGFALQTRQYAGLLRRLSSADGRVVTGRNMGTALCGVAAVGWATCHLGDCRHRHRRITAYWHPAGTRASLVAANRENIVHTVHRILERRAADHRTVLRDLHVAAISSQSLDHRRAHPGVDRR